MSNIADCPVDEPEEIVITQIDKRLSDGLIASGLAECSANLGVLCNTDTVFGRDTPRISAHRTVLINACPGNTQLCHLRITIVVRLTENLGLFQFKVFRMRCQSIVEPINILGSECLRCQFAGFASLRFALFQCETVLPRFIESIFADTNCWFVYLLTRTRDRRLAGGVVSPERGIELIPKFNKFSVSLVNRNAIPYVWVLFFMHF